MFEFRISPIDGTVLFQTVRTQQVTHKNGSKFTQNLNFILFSGENVKNNLRLEIAKLLCAILQFDSVQRHLLMIFGSKTGKCREEDPDFTR